MIKSLFGATALTLILAAVPASAQLLGGGGLGGALGGGLGGLAGAGNGSLGGSLGGMIDRAPLRSDDLARAGGSTRASKHIDTRKGHASASGTANGDSALDTSNLIGGTTLGGGADGAASGSGNADVQLVGTDAVRGATGRASGVARGAAGSARDTASGVVTRAGDAASRGYQAAGAGGAAAMGSLGQLALAGSSAASGTGTFGVMPGMDILDTHGRVIGTVEALRTTGRGTVQQVVMKVGNRTATLPAANFTGSGDALVSAMGKGAVKDAASGGRASGSDSDAGALMGSDAIEGATGRANGVANGTARTLSHGYRAAGSGSAAGSGIASGGLGQLALAGSSAANGAGSFGVMPGMAVTDVRGRVIGTVQAVRTTARGTVQQVVMQVGKRRATLPAANFTGSGDVLVSAMGKGDVKNAAAR